MEEAEVVAPYGVGDKVNVNLGTDKKPDIKTGKIVTIQSSGDGAEVDFGSGNVYGIMWNRMMPIDVEETDDETLELKKGIENDIAELEALKDDIDDADILSEMQSDIDELKELLKEL